MSGVLEKRDRKILDQILDDNRDGLERLAAERPAQERRSALKALERKVKDFFSHEDKVGHITV